jgi:hypothetical protein
VMSNEWQVTSSRKAHSTYLARHSSLL